MQLSTANKLWRESQPSLGRLQEEFLKLNKKVSQYEIDIPKLQEKVGSLVSIANSLMVEVERKMEEFQEWVNYVTPKNVTLGIPREIVDSLNEILLDKSPASIMESVSE